MHFTATKKLWRVLPQYVKTFRAMKLLALFIFAGFLQVSANGFSQKISLSGKNLYLEKVFKSIEKQTNYVFFFDEEGLKKSRPVTLDIINAELSDALEVCFKNQPLTYTIVGKTIVVNVKEKQPISITEPVVSSPPPIEVRGRVMDSSGNPISGASVVLKGLTKGTATDATGFFKITSAQSSGRLVISHIGYDSVEVSFGPNTGLLDVVLNRREEKAEEVVVVAFGRQKKQSMVSSIETVNIKDLKVPSSNLTTALAGRISGMIAYQRSGEPGRDNADFFIRGVTTFGYKVDPLILIDGVESSPTDLARLQPDDVAAFSILKDATATALYGARGANGVIQIATKEGKEGPAKISVRVENSFSSNTKNLELADPVTFMKMANEASLTRNPVPQLLYSQEKIDNTAKGGNSYMYPANDWRGLLIKDITSNQRANMSISGGGNIAKYYIAGSFSQDNGNLKVDKRNNFNSNIKLKSYQLRSNTNVSITKTTQAIVRLSGTFDDYRGPVGGGEELYKRIMRSNPVLFPAYFPSSVMPTTKHILFGNATRGMSVPGASADYINPYADMVKGYMDYSRSTLDAQLELKQDLKFITEGLNARAMFNTSRYSYFDINRNYNPYYYAASDYDRKTGNYAVVLLNAKGNPTEYLNYNEGGKDVQSTVYVEAALSYERKFNNVHNVSGMLVYQRRQQIYANQGTLQKSLPYRNQGLSGRFTYGYDNRYLAELNFGYNGSERFDESHRYGLFPAAGLGWVISNEKFFDGLSSTITKLKLKGTYGLVGNDAIGSADDRFFYLSEMNMDDSWKSYWFGQDFSMGRNGISIMRYDNRNIMWEKSYKANVGLEIGLFNAFDIHVDYFTEKRNNILMDRQSIPSTMGLASTVRANVGSAKARGVDVSIDYNTTLGSGIWLQSRANFTYAHSEFVNYEEPDYKEAYRFHNGQPIKQIYGLIAERLFIDQNDVNNSPRQTYGEYGAGDIKFYDANGDNQITDADKVPIGYPTVPEIVYGFGFSLGNRHFDFSAFFQGSARSSFWLDGSNTSPFQNDVPLIKAYADDHWSESNRNVYALWPRLSPNIVGNNTAMYNTWFMRNGAFLRLKSVELGYSLPQKLVKRAYLNSSRFYVSGTNLLLISGFDLWDIEMGGNGLGYPIQRVINVGLQLGF